MGTLLKETGAYPHLSIIIPAYNEETRILNTLLVISKYIETLTYVCEVIVVDDGSSDSTLSICREFSASHERFDIITYQENRGKGYAVRTGMLRASGAYMLLCDADLATPIEEIEGFWEYMDDDVDIVVASRPLHKSHLVKRQPMYREMAGRTLNLLVQLLAVPGIKDTQCGFKLFRKEAAHNIFVLCTIDGFSFDIEVLHVAQKLGYGISEAAVHWYHRSGSKVRFLRDGTRMLADLIRIRIRHRRLSGCVCNETR
ncbi:MAG: dolichyl-phosphate beta-glucosyltransferase [Armatimonadota bacterium]